MQSQNLIQNLEVRSGIASEQSKNFSEEEHLQQYPETEAPRLVRQPRKTSTGNSELRGRYLIYDLEIIKGIAPKDDADRIPGIEYCSGWTDYRNMGISVWAQCYMDLSKPSEEWEIRSGTDLQEFKNSFEEFSLRLISPLPVGGFNTLKFDDKLMFANDFAIESDFDIFQMVLDAADMQDVAYWKLEPRRVYNLAAITAANDLVKTLSGEQAPIEWQRGNKQLVIDYCRNDVRIEALTLKLLLEGELIDPNTGEKLHYVDEVNPDLDAMEGF